MESNIVLITGSESGIGYATSRIFLEHGAYVIGLDKNNSGSFSSNSQYELIQTDLTKLSELESRIIYIYDKFGRIDILVNCAGVTSLTSVLDLTSEEWDLVMNINLKSMFFCCKYVLKGMIKKKKGKIVNISSNAGKTGGEIVGPHYSASKAGVLNLTISLAQFAAKYHINVNCVAPGPTGTSMTSEWDDSSLEVLKSKIPFSRFGKPEEVAEAIYFLSSNKSDYITGEIIDVNGGLLMD